MKKILRIFTIILLLMTTLSLTSCTKEKEQQAIYTQVYNHIVNEVCSDNNYGVEVVSCSGYKYEDEICYKYEINYISSVYGSLNTVVYALYNENGYITCSYCNREYNSELWNMEYNLRFAVYGEVVECSELPENDIYYLIDSLWGSFAQFIGLK